MTAQERGGPVGTRGGTHFAPGAKGPSRSSGRVALRALSALDGAGGWAPIAAISFLAVVLTWRWQAWDPVQAGLSSWQAGVTIAFLHHLQWGPQMIFTFGPFGFLEDALPYARLTAALGLAYGVALRLGLAALVVSALRKPWGLLAAGVAAWLSVGLAADLAEASELAMVVALGLALASFRAMGHRRLALLALLGALAGIEVLVEITAGAVCTGLAALAVAGTAAAGPMSGDATTGDATTGGATTGDATTGGATTGDATTGGRAGNWLRALLATGGAWASVALAALLASGQSLTNFPSYLRGSLSVVRGYTPAMSLSTGRVTEDWLAVCVLALLGTVFAFSLRGRASAEKIIISLALAGWAWELGKEGFVRHDLHDLTFFGLVVPALGLARLSRRLAPLQGAAIAVAAVFACVANGSVPLSLRSPLESPRALASAVADLTSGPRWAEVRQAVERQSRRSGDGLPGRLYRALLGHSFAAVPVEDSMTTAYPRLRLWDPEPVLQAYSAYTPYLDHLDSAFLAGTAAPELILYRPVSIGHVDPAWEPPSGTEAMYCHYAEAFTDSFWLLLHRVRDRCGTKELLGEVTGRFGEPITVPREPAGAGKMVLATMSVSLPASTGIEDTLFKGPAVHLTAWAAGGARSTYRFVTATAGDDHVMSAPASLGYTAGYGPPAVRRFELTGGGWQAGQGTVRVRFYALSLRPAPAHR